VGRGLQGEILSRIHRGGIQDVAAKSMRLTKEEAAGFTPFTKPAIFSASLRLHELRQ